MNNTHWVIGAICGASSTIEIFDSLVGDSSTLAYQKAYENMKKLWTILAGAWSKTPDILDQEWKLVIPSKIPWQGNNSDCGIFAIMYLIHLGYGPEINHEQVPILYRLRRYSENMAGMRLLLLKELEL
ncbi:hypothetical protein GYMLUDRAFT_244225 [Collybiopsis luxurians FD-317 M1]|uniref:Ubiquitin-like protease family profile domain-containing protein n=1 Tax=Collybiopsis luxurians FD-317 M1 TaxID=944289 RepID=A0A0D0CWX0_9AGAR|nr:hypothetical protein GYMLUDRAFT_244225 [Collybiopsis luxurians FD-317 M1]